MLLKKQAVVANGVQRNEAICLISAVVIARYEATCQNWADCFAALAMPCSSEKIGSRCLLRISQWELCWANQRLFYNSFVLLAQNSLYRTIKLENMYYKRMSIEIEAPEGFGYENIDCNLSESSFTDQNSVIWASILTIYCSFTATTKANPNCENWLSKTLI